MAGNWKANGSPASIQSRVATLNSGRTAATTEVVVAPPSIFLGDVRAKLRKDFSVSAQDAFASTGAHTGETPVALLKDAGVKYTIVGHSERRQKGETNEIVAGKAKDLKEGVAIGTRTLDSGAAAAKLKQLVAVSNG